jgi:hypothetical protein
VNKTKGTMRAVRNLRDRVETMQKLRGENVVPEVLLRSKPMPTDFGQKMRPHWEIVDWRRFGGGAPQLPGPDGGPKQIEHAKPTKAGEPVKPATTEELLNDEVPF